ncbi:MAG TPA: CRISPR-associated helicase Cas3' [Streptosporangiaceae bacterium]|nr:CRISPR-associated helicase Cas3' [Streptosporangiaceae bacterium]
MQTFDELFRAATGHAPHGYQARIARDGLPSVVEAPTGTGKTGIILAWLWRRLDEAHRDATPRRLVYALPQRSLVDHVAGEAGRWLANLELDDQIALHVVMGGAGESQRQWRMDMHQPAIVVGTADSLVSKALNRGYGIGRASYPIDWALVTNGAHWVIDEIQLCQESTTTLRQVAAFAKAWGTAEPFGLTCMSAILPEELLETMDRLERGDTIRILPEERTRELAVRLGADRTIRRLDAEPGDYKAIAAAARDRHQAGALTLVVLNTVEAARAVYQALRGGPAECTLLHSRFRALDRPALMAAVTGHPEDRIVVATQVVEAGLDLSAAVLITEVAPWPSLVQRAGRCNRTGLVPDAELWWVAPARPQPYEQADIDTSSAELAQLDGRAVTGEDLLGRDVAVTETPVAVLRRNDFVGLFDTTLDLSGADVDISPYVQDAEDLDAQLVWAAWTADTAAGAPPAEARAPGADFRCRVPLGQVTAVARDIPVWRMNQVLGRWTRVTPQARARPGEVLLVSAADGGYDPVTGFDPAARGPVLGSPSIDLTADPAAGAEDPYRADSLSVAQGEWVSLGRHSEDTRDQAAALLKVIGPALPDGAARTVATAAYLHDVGKAHPIWQDALCSLAPEEHQDEITAGRPWAKSGTDLPLRFAGGVAFRHELASLLILDGPLRGLLADAPDPDLTRYLVLAHHGKLRVQVRDPGDLAVLPVGEASQDTLLGLEQGAIEDIPPMLGLSATRLTVDLEQFRLSGERSWTRTVLGLRDRYGPFVLAYLETVVRIADWRASAGLEVAR